MVMRAWNLHFPPFHQSLAEGKFSLWWVDNNQDYSGVGVSSSSPCHMGEERISDPFRVLRASGIWSGYWHVANRVCQKEPWMKVKWLQRTKRTARPLIWQMGEKDGTEIGFSNQDCLWPTPGGIIYMAFHADDTSYGCVMQQPSCV